MENNKNFYPNVNGYYNAINQYSGNINSYFDGNFMQLSGWNLLCALIAVCTLGIGIPWAMCLKIRWETKHTVINGKRLYFNGTAAQLFGKLIVWLIFMAIIFIIPIIIAVVSSQPRRTSSYYYGYYSYRPSVNPRDLIANILLAIIIDLILGIFIVNGYFVYLKKWTTKHTTFVDDKGIPYEHMGNGNMYYPNVRAYCNQQGYSKETLNKSIHCKCKLV